MVYFLKEILQGFERKKSSKVLKENPLILSKITSLCPKTYNTCDKVSKSWLKESSFFPMEDDKEAEDDTDIKVEAIEDGGESREAGCRELNSLTSLSKDMNSKFT